MGMAPNPHFKWCVIEYECCDVLSLTMQMEKDERNMLSCVEDGGGIGDYVSEGAG